MKGLSVTEAVATLQAGGVIAYPTEAVWGLGCDPRQRSSVERLLRIKQRPVEKGVIVVASKLEVLADWLNLTALPTPRLRAVLASWPGPNTWILPASTHAPEWITGRHCGIAVRLSAHPQVRALCQAWMAPLVSTSANLSGRRPARTRSELDPALLGELDGLLDGDTSGLAQPTPIHDALTGEILRD